jgi:hypothetical protein
MISIAVNFLIVSKYAYTPIKYFAIQLIAWARTDSDGGKLTSVFDFIHHLGVLKGRRFQRLSSFPSSGEEETL